MSKFIGDKKFYRMLLTILLPIVLQLFITQFVSLIDNIMVGRIGNDDMIGVSLANQLLFVFNLGIFGSMGGASIFATQYYGSVDKDGYQESFRFKWLVGGLITILAILILGLFPDSLLNTFIKDVDGEFSNGDNVLNVGKSYLFIMLFGLIPFTIKEIYSTTLREQKETLIPMLSGVAAIFVNLGLNYLLIFGKMGFPVMGAKGAAIATVISRIVEMLVVILYVQLKKDRFKILDGVYKKIFVRRSSIKKFMPKTLLLMTNELLWSLGLTIVVNCFSYRGLDVIGAVNIKNTVCNVFVTTGNSLGQATTIILGNLIGAGAIEDAHKASYRLLFSALMFSIVIAAFEYLSSYFIPSIYNTSAEIKEMAATMIRIEAFLLPMFVFNTTCYFILRTGGKILLTMGFDSLFVWAVRIPLALIFAKYTSVGVLMVVFISDAADVLKTAVGYILVDRGIWLNRMVE